MPYKHKEDQREYGRRHYYLNREKYLESLSKYNRRIKEELKLEISSLKEKTPCADCEKYYPHYIMDFDHVVGDKIGNVSALVAGGRRKRVFEEIAKCELVCANCHRQRTWERLLVRDLTAKVSDSYSEIWAFKSLRTYHFKEKKKMAPTIVEEEDYQQFEEYQGDYYEPEEDDTDEFHDDVDSRKC